MLDQSALVNLSRINLLVNHNIKPATDMQHYGMIQWWRYPDDRAGACHSYALLKRRMLIEAGWPRQALLMTIVHEIDGEGHAVLTVVTNRGDYILDNLTDKNWLWSQTPYRYYKRQSQEDPNKWIWIKGARTDFPTSAIRTPQRVPIQRARRPVPLLDPRAVFYLRRRRMPRCFLRTSSGAARCASLERDLTLTMGSAPGAGVITRDKLQTPNLIATRSSR